MNSIANHHHRLVRTLLLRPTTTLAGLSVRWQSCWSTTSQQNSNSTNNYSKRPRQSYSSINSNRRPVINGKPVAFHINDLPQFSDAHHNQHQQQQQYQQQKQQQHQAFVTSSPSASRSSSSSSSSPSLLQNQTPKSSHFHHQEQVHHSANYHHLPYKPIRQYDSDLIVVLDMDECLIHSQFLQGPGAKYAHQVKRAGSLGEAVVDTFSVYLPEGEEVRVHERPHLHEFLARVSEKYETHVFTAAQEVYAKPVLKMLDPHGKIFTHCWYRESCELNTNIDAYVKNLNPLFGAGSHRPAGLQRTVLVDNNPLSFLANPENGILVSSFYNDPRDTTLVAVLDLLDELDQQPDVRPTLEARFGLRKALQELSKGGPFQGRDRQLDEAEVMVDEDEDEEEVLTPNLVAAGGVSR